MKNKYLSRKFIVCIVGLILSIVATALDNTTVALSGVFLAGCFVIGESIVDACASIKRQHIISVTDNKVASEKDDK